MNSGIRFFRINEHLSLRLEGKETMVCVEGEPFRQCKALMLVLPRAVKELEKLELLESIDELKIIIGKMSEYHDYIELSPEEEFQGHCSNLQAWYEHDYDTRLIDSSLGFSLLKRLSEAGDLKAKKVLKKEIAERLMSGYESVAIILNEEGFVDLLTRDEFWRLFPDKFSPLRKVEGLLGCPFDYQGGDTRYGRKRNPRNAFYFTKRVRLAFTTEGKEEGMRLGYVLIRNLPPKDETTWEKVFQELGKLEGLTFLRINNCPMAKVPESLGLLKELRELHLHNSEIEILPDSLENLIRLEKFEAAKNKLENFPTSLTKIKSLKSLIMTDNLLEEIPDSLVNLVNLEGVEFSFNRIVKVNQKVLKQIKSFKGDYGFGQLSGNPIYPKLIKDKKIEKIR